MNNRKNQAHSLEIPNATTAPSRASGGIARDNDGVVAQSGPKPHVMLMIEAVGHGGAERVAEELALHTDPTRFRRSVLVTRPLDRVTGSAEAYERLRDSGVEVHLLNRRNTLDRRALQRLVGLLRSRHVDVLHAHMFGSNVWAALLGHPLGVPVVVAHEHTWSFEGQPLRKVLDHHVVARFSDQVIAVSEADRRRMIDTVRMPAERVTLIPNGITWTGGGDPSAVRRELGIGPDAPVLVQTAVLREQKAIDVMVSAMAILRDTHPDARLLVAGPGDPAQLRALAAELGLAERVLFLGGREDVADLLAAANVGVLSSDFEGMPLAVLEYMAAGLPVVSTRVGGVPEMVKDGESGLLAPPRDPRALAAALARLLDDPALARTMGERGRSRQRERFSGQAMTARVDALYEELLSAKGITVPRSAPAPMVPAETPTAGQTDAGDRRAPDNRWLSRMRRSGAETLSRNRDH
jgi:glycosyltransferase involved in cell wall biosynthesis